MRKSIPQNEEASQEQNYYQSLLNQEHARIMAETNGGLGLQPMILKDILPSHLQKQLQHYQQSAFINPQHQALQRYQEQMTFNERSR